MTVADGESRRMACPRGVSSHQSCSTFTLMTSQSTMELVTSYTQMIYNNNNNCLKSNIQCIEIRVQWTVHLGSSHMHVHAVTRVHAVTPKLVICVMYLTSIWRILLMTDGLNAVWSNDRAAHTDTNPRNLKLAPPQSITATRLDQLVYSPNYYIQIFQTQNNCPQWEANLHPARSESWAFATTPHVSQLYVSQPSTLHSPLEMHWNNSHSITDPTVCGQTQIRHKLLHFIWGTKRPIDH